MTDPDLQPDIVLVSQRDGRVISQSNAAVQLMGKSGSSNCWELVRGLAKHTHALPCHTGCVERLIHTASQKQGDADDRQNPLSSVYSPVELRDQTYALHCVPAGEHVVSVFCKTEALSDLLESPRSWEHLTRRELDVLELLAEGDTTATIAKTLHISCGTVRTHVEHMRNKLDAKTRAALVARGFMLGFLR